MAKWPPFDKLDLLVQSVILLYEYSVSAQKS